MTHTLETPVGSTAGGLVRLLFIQNGSLFDQFGGIEYYLDDLETDLAHLLGGLTRARLLEMAELAREAARPDATREVADVCEALAAPDRERA